MKKPKLRNNVGQFQKYATIVITKELEQVAEETGVNVRLVVADKLKETYKQNLIASYGPRSEEGQYIAETHKKKTSTYTHEHKLEEAINTIIDGKTVKVVIDESKTYDDGTPVTQVYEWLTKGTTPPQHSYYTSGETKLYMRNGKLVQGLLWYRNYPTPVHLFEEHTNVQMQGFVDSLANKIKQGEYTTYRYTGKKKKRRYYRGEDLRQG